MKFLQRGGSGEKSLGKDMEKNFPTFKFVTVSFFT